MGKVGKFLVMILMVLISTSCTSNDPAIGEKDRLEWEEQISHLREENTMLKDQGQQNQNDLNEIRKELENLKSENQDLLVETRRYEDLINFMEYEHLDAYSFSGEIYTGPSKSADPIEFFPGIIFVIDEFYNEASERWLEVESVFSLDESKSLGYLMYDQDLLKPMEEEYAVNKDLSFDGHYIGQSADALLNNVSAVKNYGKGEQSWHIHINGNAYGIDPISWTIKSVYISNSEVLVDDQFRVGDLAEDVIQYYGDRYPIFYAWKTMEDKPNNWFVLDEYGYVLNIVYDTDVLTADSLVEEFKVFNQYDMN